MKKPILLLLLFLLLALLLTSAARAQPAPGPLAVPPAMLDRIDREAEATLARLYRLSPPRRPWWRTPSACWWCPACAPTAASWAWPTGAAS